MEKQKVIIICGPTSSGKTALAFRLAGERKSSIISADSRQVYRGLDTVTGRDIPAAFIRKDSTPRFKDRPVVVYEKDNIRLWGFELLFPDETYNAADFSDLTGRVVRQEQAEDRTVFIVGGTGFFLKALTEPDSLAPTIPDENLRAQLSSLSKEELAEKLWETNPQRFVALNQSDASNPRRLIRAIEVAQTSTQPKPAPPLPQLNFVWVGIKLPLPEIIVKIGSRVKNRLAKAVSEVATLLAVYPDQSLPIYTTLGVKPILKFLAGEITREQLQELWVTDEANYAKRQITWFKKQKTIIWYDQSSLGKIKLDELL
ncbi:hypothetical protein A3A84_01845 [Candidatus Collierbacteria bacterium RIFCSPLOWO2_01_FULL_50_23]|uniref:tRNA dimethylallyltransferase n=1 Tax=Candidatus Collierbacteria bacterium RIFCSPHIGHO2_01_FULL_50_25 TaxID=1817722 RepID=A0A1F5EXR1_9BACT|nr:MAG: hypothetical protein A2703_00135 [Candidatus Collierbacteria bacterium RIFCSPHIGHO2_01_FULL_50_25]OGD74137.1 MAG: hypothetical protein A3A84_01845 [Candidatus Collierbacteria bacterium RIFCSPLOWO2_01_FULL_50_23]